MTDEYPDIGAALPMPSLGPEDLGLPQAPVAPMRPMASPQGQSTTARIMKLVALGIAGGLGPGAGTGLLQGMNIADQRQHQERQRNEAIQRQTYQQDRTDYEQQQRLYDANLRNRQQTVEKTIAYVRASVPKIKSKAEYDHFIDSTATMLQAQGVRLDGNFLRSTARYLEPDVQKGALELYNDFAKNPLNKDRMDDADYLGGITVLFDSDGDGKKEKTTVLDLGVMANVIGIDKATGKPVVTKANSREAKADADGYFQDFLAKATAEGKQITPELRSELRDQALKRAKEASALPKEPTQPRDRFSIQPVTNVDGTTSIVRVNLETGSATPVVLGAGIAGAGKPTESAGKTAQFLPRVVEADKNANVFEGRLSRLGPQMDAQMPNLLRSAPGQLYRQAQDEFINAGLRDESGAAIQPSEYDRYRSIYFAVPGDTPATLAQKREARARVIQGIRLRAGNLAQGTAAPSASPTVPNPVGRFNPATGKVEPVVR